MSQRPLIMLSNDDGIDSPGIHAAAGALLPIADILISAPKEQQSATGRSYRIEKNAAFEQRELDIEGTLIKGWALDASPASSVNHGLQCLVQGRKPDMVVSGINIGENIGTDTTASGTVGAAMQAAIYGYKAIAISREFRSEFHFTYENLGNRDIWQIPKAILLRAVKLFIDKPWPDDVHVIKIDIPDDVTDDTDWVFSRQALMPGWTGIIPDAHPGSTIEDVVPKRMPLNDEGWGDGTDCQTLVEKRKISITPLSFDLTSRVTQDSFLRALPF